MLIASCQLPDIQENTAQSLAIIINYAKQAEAQGASLVCFPECYLQGYLVNHNACDFAIDLSSRAFENILKQLADIRPMLVIGLIEANQAKLYNTAVVVKAGKLVGAYRKVKLYGNENNIFAPGNEFPVFDTAGFRFGINICNDLNFPECTEAVASQGIDLLVCPCNNMMRYANAEQWKFKHNQIRAQRAIEAGIWLISADVTGERDGRISYGPTAIIDRNGSVVKQIPLLQEGLLVYNL